MNKSADDSFEDYKDKGLTGLANLGNTCFINSCVQILSNTYELNDFLNLQTYKKKLKKNGDAELLVEWDNLRKLMWRDNCIISPNKFLSTIQRIAAQKNIEIFTGFAQNDLPEFLLFMVDCFHNALSRKVNISVIGKVENKTDKLAVCCFEMIKKMYKNDYSEIWSMFYGVHVSQIISSTSETNEVLSMNAEPYFMINLSIPPNNKNPTLYDCFDHYVEGELLEGENAWYNEKTKEKESVLKQISYWSLPDILVIDIKRFNSQNRKIQNVVDFPLENADFSKYVIGYKKESYIYNLYGICNHSGGVFGGHYTSFVKNANGKWYLYNDTSVTEVKNTRHLVSPSAYCLFYRKIKV
jgi:ubiquitin carboxyl-terminal hydrolase 8